VVDWRRVLGHLVANAEEHFDQLKYRLAYALGGPDPIKIVPYRGYGNRQQLYLKGRVLEDQGIIESRDNDSLWDNLVNMYRRIESDEVPHARLKARLQDVEQEVLADEEGMFDVCIAPRHPLPADRLWHSVELELVEPLSRKQAGPVRATGYALVPLPSARLVVISDIDDTVIEADVAHLLNLARNVFLRNAHTRLPFPGVAAFYRALFHGPQGDAMNPIFYVSNSPWNLYDLLSEFFQLHDIPIGPILFLRNYGISEESFMPFRHQAHKLGIIRQMLDFYPDLPFILIGDSGQKDPEIYAEVVDQYQQRIQAVYIRNVSLERARSEGIGELAARVAAAGSTLILADDSLAMAEHAAAQGWISPAALADIRAEKEKDEQPPGPVEKLLGAEETPPAIIVEGKNARASAPPATKRPDGSGDG
jgi:phosphatidate phosphatase APP1